MSSENRAQPAANAHTYKPVRIPEVRYYRAPLLHGYNAVTIQGYHTYHRVPEGGSLVSTVRVGSGGCCGEVVVLGLQLHSHDRTRRRQRYRHVRVLLEAKTGEGQV